MTNREANQILKAVLDIAEEIMKSGAEMRRAEDSLLRLCTAYGFKNVNVWLISSNIQVTVETPEGDIITQIRYVRLGESNFDRLDYLNNLSRYVCKYTPDADTVRTKLDEVLARPTQARWLHYLAGIMGGTGFAVFFNCNLMDAIVAVLASIIVVFLGEVVEKYESNPLIFNAIISFAVEAFILVVVKLGVGEHHGYITLGVVMLMISGLGITNGIRDLLNRDILSGSINIANAVLGAAGIAIGISLPILIMRGFGLKESMVLNPNVYVQLASCTVACVGFALWFKVKGIQVLYSGVGAFFTWLVYVLVYEQWPSNFLATFAGALFVAAYAIVMAKVNKAPATIFLTTSVFPLIPGPNLYYMMYNVVMERSDAAIEEAIVLIVTCLGIALGFIVVEIINKYLNISINRFRGNKAI